MKLFEKIKMKSGTINPIWNKRLQNVQILLYRGNKKLSLLNKIRP